MSAITRRCCRLPLAFAFLLVAGLAHGITINMEYTDEGDTPPHPENPSWDPDGTILKNHFNAAKAIWESLLPGGGEYTFDFHWDDDIPGLGLATQSGVDDFIEINPNFDWFADPDPLDDAEFNAGQQELFGGLSASDRTTFFPDFPPPATLEVSFRATGLLDGTFVDGVPVNTLSASQQVVPGTATPVDASNGYDLLSVILHEVGHILGISGTEPGNYNIYPQHVGGDANVTVLEHPESGHLGGNEMTPGFLMNPATPRGQRVYATATDVLVIAEDQGITVVQLARVGSIISTSWSTSLNWIGGDVPNATQDVYIAHGGGITLDVDASVKSMLVSPGNSLAVGGRQFRAAETLNSAGGALSVAAGGTIEAHRIVGDPASLSTTPGSLVRFDQFSTRDSSTTGVTFQGSVEIGIFTPMASQLAFEQGAITTWTISENLTVGDARGVSHATGNSTWSVGGDVKVGDSRSLLLIQEGGTVNVGGDLLVSGSNKGYSDLVVELGGSLDVTGSLVAGPYGRVTYRTGTSVTDRLEIKGGATAVKHDPPLAPHFTYGAGGSLTVEGTANVFGSTIDVDGGIGNGAPSGSVLFATGANASNAQVHTRGGRKGGTSPVLAGLEIAGNGGSVRFEGDASAWQARIVNEGVWEYFGGTGGRTIFVGASTAENAEIHNHGATHVNGGGGATQFFGSSTAASATITNHADGTYSPADTLGATSFFDFSTAGSATIENEGSPSQSNSPGRTEFRGESSAENATIHNRGHLTPGGLAGRTIFYDGATAADATIQLYEGYIDAGRVEFHGASKGGAADIIVNNVPSIVGSSGNGGHVLFFDQATAEDATITLSEGACCNGVQFFDNAKAGSAVIIQQDRSGNTEFWNSSSAEKATFLVGNGPGVTFRDQSTAAGATFTLAPYGRLRFVQNASAGTAQIVANGASVYTGAAAGGVTFVEGSTAHNADIVVHGATAPLAPAAYVSFTGGASSGNSTITSHGGSNGGVGSTIFFNGAANGSTARLVANAGSLIDFVDQRTYNEISFGSIEGAGTLALRGAHVTVGSRNSSTTVSGPIVDNLSGLSAGGQLTKVGSGTLTLAGANTYSSFTTVNEGAVTVSGSIVGGAIVNAGGVLNGSGTIIGGVTVNAGGVFAPGLSPGAITVDDLTLQSGSALNFELGAAARDRIVVVGGGDIALGGALNVTLLDGYTPTLGQSFPLFEGEIGAIVGSFDTVVAPIFNGLTFSLVQSAGFVALEVGAAPLLPGDYNVDGVVDAADYTVWRDNLGRQASLPNDDTPGVAADDYTRWRSYYGAEAAAAAETVPEPTSSMMTFLLSVAAGVHARRRNSPW